MSEATRVQPLSADQSLGALVNSAVGDVKNLVKMEKELAMAEVQAAIRRLAPAIGGFVAAAAAGALILLFGSVALAYAIADLFGIGLGWGFFIVTGLWLLVAAVGALFGRAQLKKVKGPERTIRTVKETADWARHPTSPAPDAAVVLR